MYSNGQSYAARSADLRRNVKYFSWIKSRQRTSQLRRAEKQANQQLLQIKNSELALSAKTSQLNTEININLELTSISNTLVSKDVSVAAKATQKSNKSPTNVNT